MEGSNYPLASLILIFYRQEQFVAEAVAGALAQTYPNLEIILSDDNSPDGTFEEIQKAVKDYKGPHKIIVNRNDKNIGLVPHVNKTMFDLSHGDYIFLDGGDDISLPNRVEIGVKAFLENPSIPAVTYSRVIIDKNGYEIGKVEVAHDSVSVIDQEYLKKGNFMAGAGALSLSRTLLDTFGRLNDDCQTEDSVLRFRALLLGGIFCLHNYGLKYRVHDNNISRSFGNFNTDLIAKQYKKDLKSQKEYLTGDLYEALLSKIDFYQQYRLYQVLYEQTKSPLKRILFLIRMRSLKSKYLKGLSQMSIY